MENKNCSDYAKKVAEDIESLLSSDIELTAEIGTAMSVLGGLDQHLDPRAVAIACFWQASMVLEQDLNFFCDGDEPSDKVVIQACDIMASSFGTGFDYSAVCGAIGGHVNGDCCIDQDFAYSIETKKHMDKWPDVAEKMKDVVDLTRGIHTSKQCDYRRFASK